jgi:hypothetical protein
MSTSDGPENAIYDTTTDKRGFFGQRMAPDSERVFRYARNGAVALEAGTLVQAPQQERFHTNLTVAAAAAVGKAKVTLTNKSVLIERDQYLEGFLYINDVGGQGYMYRVKTHPKAEISASCVVEIRGNLIVALTTSSQATLVTHPYDQVVPSWKEPSDAALGVAACAVAANEYFWVQTWGPAAVLQEGSLFPGKAVSASRQTVGAVATAENLVSTAETRDPPDRTHVAAVTQKEKDGKTAGATQKLSVLSGHAVLPEITVGHCIDARVDTEHALIYLTILN